MADPTRAIARAAAIQAGLRAWRAGENVQAVLGAAGYARDIVNSVVSYIVNDPEEADREAGLYERGSVAQSTVRTVGRMSSHVKRVKVVAEKKKTPVSKNVKQYVKHCTKRLLEDKCSATNVLANTTTTGGVTLGTGLYNIIQGTGVTNRTGNFIHIKSYTCHIGLSCGIGLNAQVRFILLNDKQANNGSPTISGLPEGVLDSASWLANYNCATVVGYGGSRYNIIYDKVFTFNNQVAANTTVKQFRVHFNKKVQRPVHYGASAGANTDINSNALYWLVIADSVNVNYDMYNSICFVDN